MCIPGHTTPYQTRRQTALWSGHQFVAWHCWQPLDSLPHRCFVPGPLSCRFFLSVQCVLHPVTTPTLFSQGPLSPRCMGGLGACSVLFLEWVWLPEVFLGGFCCSLGRLQTNGCTKATDRDHEPSVPVFAYQLPCHMRSTPQAPHMRPPAIAGLPAVRRPAPLGPWGAPNIRPPTRI